MTALLPVPAAAPPVADATARRRRRRREALAGYLFLSPGLVLFIVFIAGPFAAAMVLSLYSWDLLTPREFVGLDNFTRLLSDPLLPRVMANTFLFAFASVATHIGGGLLLALAVNRPMNRVLSYFTRSAIFFPFLLSWAAVALLWKYVLDPGFGLVAYYLGRIGIDAPNWFVDPSWSLTAIIGIDFWYTIGFTFIILLAGLQTVPTELVEAARTDGANSRQILFNVIIPMMSPVLFFATIITFIGAFQIFDPIHIITGGGPENSTRTIVMYLYQTGFQAFQIGYASAIAILIFFVIMGVTLLQFWGARKWVHER
ncbi:carbohydrate ABC transporter permease [Phytoactinopolyspora limicola]|uniref:carbohydrate ABC transporter permease n=1 Tax=Phytoactinopolyspora limicola TaxID=2715536 RepID=UPI001A9C9A4B|nr:sugar ABC transporter permease [Phytoactinopolyspora limicola]